MHPPRSSKLIGEYYDELKQKVEKLKRGVQRLDMVFDVYREKRLKTQTRDARGKGIRVAVRKETLMPKDFHSFIRNCMNKTELFKLLAEVFIDTTHPVIVSTSLDHVLSNLLHDKQGIDPCNHEEADIRVLHVADGSSAGFRKISILTVDTDVVVISLYHFFALGLRELWIEFAVGKSK